MKPTTTAAKALLDAVFECVSRVAGPDDDLAWELIRAYCGRRRYLGVFHSSAVTETLQRHGLMDDSIDPNEKVADLQPVDIAAELRPGLESVARVATSALSPPGTPRPVRKGVVSDRAELDTTIQPSGMQANYLVLSEEERAKGFVRPVRRSYKHVGIAGPKFPLRDLDESQLEKGLRGEFAKFEVYPCGNPIAGEQKWCIREAEHGGKCCPQVSHPPTDLRTASCCADHGDERLGVSTGRYWSQEDLDRVGKGCGTVTTMGLELAETYAREPRFYGSTFCCGCHTHLPVGADGEFVWDGTDVRVGT